jgi:uncharacterized membrane protein YidH (DUF202 family)
MPQGDAQVHERDPGLQAERTSLAWSRTALAVLANALLILRSGWANERDPIMLLGLVLLLAAAAVYWLGYGRRRELLAGRSAPRNVVIRAVAIIGFAACAIGLGSVLVP